jgi:Tfp pilus assembly protein FimT
MKWLRRFKNSVYFVDVILVIAVLIAAFGFAAFVRLNEKNKSVVEAPAQTVSAGFTKAEALEATETDQPTEASPKASNEDKPPGNIISETHNQNHKVYQEASSSAIEQVNESVAGAVAQLPASCDLVKKVKSQPDLIKHLPAVDC